MTASPFTASKSELRAAIHARRDGLPIEQRRRMSEQICERATSLEMLADARVLGVYMPIRSEVDPLPIIDWAFARSFEVALPAIGDDDVMVFRRYRHGDALVRSRFGTQKPPDAADEIDPHVVVVPIIGFDRTGMRLGHGRGYYDRALAALAARGRRPIQVGVAFSVQEVASIPAEGHDIPMDYIVTERETLHFDRGRKE
jgi:5-formyltetrahydrofolate cyclo-ligase